MASGIEPYETKAGTRYRVRYRTPDRRQTDKRGFETVRDAKQWQAENVVSIANGEYVAPSAARVTVGELGPAWLERKRHRKPSTYRSLETAWRVHVEPRWGRVAVADVATTAVQAWVTDMSTGDEARKIPPKSATVVGRAYGVLAGILDDAVTDRRARANVARGVTLPRKSPKGRTYLTHEQVQQLAQQAGKVGAQYETLVYVLAYCGLRWGEATGLRVRNLDMLRRRLAIEENAVQVGSAVKVGSPKTHERRSVPFPSFLAPLLAKRCEDKGRDDLVFTSPTNPGKHLKRSSSATAKSWFVLSVKRAGIPRVTPHDLRHTAASLAVSSGANVKAVQRMLGHASAAMTLDVYADLFDADLDAVAVELDAARRRSLVI